MEFAERNLTSVYLDLRCHILVATWTDLISMVHIIPSNEPRFFENGPIAQYFLP